MKLYKSRLKTRIDELKWLYMELYQGQDNMFSSLLENMEAYYRERCDSLKELDKKREKDKDWYRRNDLLGMMMYTENFGGNLKGVKKHLDYLEKTGVNYIHLMPLLEVTEGKSDGGYAVSDYRKVQERLGSMEDLEDLTSACHDKGICVCLDYVMNHTSEDHEWARRARNLEKVYMDMYFFYDNYDIPAQFEKTVPEVFPTTAPGNFTYLPEIGKHVMTSFYPYQWDLNYWNPRVFNEMVYNMLFLANAGIDIIRIDAVPYIWKQLGTNCRNLPQVHTIVRMMRIISEIVCPSVIFLGEVVMEPKELAPYFGSIDKPECHLLYNATSMCTLWHTVATADVELLKYQTDQVCQLPKEYGFVNYIRCHDDIGWGLDYNFLLARGYAERDHKKYLNDYFLGNVYGSMSCGELYNADPVSGDARFCGTTASMCGIERAGFEKNEELTRRGIALDLLLHSFIFFQSGIPVIYSGDEIAALNDWSYKEDPLKIDDSRYVHRGKFDWSLAKNINKRGTVQKDIYSGLKKMYNDRRADNIFDSDTDVYTIETHNQSVLGMIRINQNERVVGLFNFSDREQRVDVYELPERELVIGAYEYRWVKL